ncbi:hypothetical protein V7158_29255 [Priestia megaterium]|uniref:hypothetical protein n=1 Tax=Priestia megaterium TaxID=1404 RepID=UPI002FFEAAAA
MNYEKTEEKKVQIWKDAAILVFLLTSLGYFLTYAFRQGYINYFKLEGIARSDIEVSDISLAIYTVYSHIVLAIIIYTITTLILIMTKAFDKFLINPIAITFAIVITFQSIYQEISISSVIKCVITVVILTVLRKLIKPNFSRLKELLVIWNSVIPLKWITIVLILLLTFQAFYDLGGKGAHDKTEYLIVKQGDIDYAVVEEKGSNLIITRVNLNTKTIQPKYSIIDPKSNIKKTLKFERTVIDGGLTVIE